MTNPAVRVPDLAVADLRARLAGRVMTPDDADYDEARRVVNAAIDRRPAAVARVSDTTDVAAAVAFAREGGLDLAVRGGGHGLAGHGVVDDGLVLDLSELRALEIDPGARTAWAQAGLTAGEYTGATARHGLATGFGDTGSVGIGGITLGGGIGWFARKHGLTIDDLLAVELVTADGEVLHVDADAHGELFWALRGGGGNFGVVTRLKYRLHPVGTVLGGMLVLPASPELVRSFVFIADAAPDDLTTIAYLAPAPPLPAIPAEHHGRLALTIMLMHAGDPDAGERAIAPLRALATPLVDEVKQMAYPEMFDVEEPPRAMLAVRSTFLDDLDAPAVNALFDRLADVTLPMAAVQIRVLGGAVARTPADGTAFAHRERRMLVAAAAASELADDAPARDAWVESVMAGLPGSRGAFVNFLTDDGPTRVRAAYPGTTLERLRAVKRRYDPTNLFRSNQNIDPDG